MTTALAARPAALIAAALALVVGLGPAASAQPAAGYKSGREFYLAYRAAFTKARALEDLLPWMARSRRDEIAKVPAAERAQGFEMLKMFDDHIGITVVKETPSATGAVLQVEATTAAENARETAIVTLVKEAGLWKLGEESWKGGK